MFTQRFSSTPRGARLARRLVLHQLDAWGVPHGSEAPDTAALLVAELAANAVTHGRVPGRDFEVTLKLLGRTLSIEVSDTRGELRPPAPERPAPRSGRSRRPVGACSWWRRSPTGGRSWTAFPSARRSSPSWTCGADRAGGPGRSR